MQILNESIYVSNIDIVQICFLFNRHRIELDSRPISDIDIRYPTLDTILYFPSTIKER